VCSSDLDTSERMGPVDTVRGRSKKATQDEEAKAPSKTCPECGNDVHAAVMVCEACGYAWPEPEKQPRSVSMAPILSTPSAPKITRYEVSHASYRLHRKLGKPDSMRVEYWSGMSVVGTEWVCFEHDGYARKKAVDWWQKRSELPVPDVSRTAVDTAEINPPRQPVAIFVDESNKFPEIVKYEFQEETAETE
jgi:DNA repair protein RadD